MQSPCKRSVCGREHFPTDTGCNDYACYPARYSDTHGKIFRTGTDTDIFACILQYPNASGNAEDYRAFVEKAHAANCKVAVAADILKSCPCSPLPENGELILYSVPPNASVHRCSMADRQPGTRYARRIQTQYSGRIIGWSKDKYGKLCYRMALQNPRATYQTGKGYFKYLYRTGSAGNHGGFLCRVPRSGRYSRHCRTYPQHRRISGKVYQETGIQTSE